MSDVITPPLTILVNKIFEDVPNQFKKRKINHICKGKCIKEVQNSLNIINLIFEHTIKQRVIIFLEKNQRIYGQKRHIISLTVIKVFLC